MAEFGIDQAIINEIADAADEHFAYAMRLARQVEGELTAHGPLGAYLEILRKEAIEAVKLLVVVSPTDSVAVLGIQSKIGAYLSLIEFIKTSMAAVSAPDEPDLESLAEDDGDRQEGGYSDS